MKGWTPELIIVAMILVGCFIMIATGINGEVKSVFVMACAWGIRAAFGKAKGT